MSSPPANTPETSDIYRGLPDDYRTIHFSNYEATANTMDNIYANTSIQYVMLTSINKTQLDNLYQRRSSPYFRADYFPRHELAVLRLCKPRVLHNGITYLLVRQLDTQAREMGMDVWTYCWGFNMLHTTTGRYKCPDECLFPRWRRQVASSGSCGEQQEGPQEYRGKGKWPTLVLETALVDSGGRLEVDAEWWLKRRAKTTARRNQECWDNSQGQEKKNSRLENYYDDENTEEERQGKQEHDTGEEQVNLVLLLKIDPPNKTLIIEKWENDGYSGGDAEEPVVRRTEAVKVSRDGISGALHLPFRGVFNREPQGQERDFFFGGQGFFDVVWRDLDKAQYSWWI